MIPLYIHHASRVRSQRNLPKWESMGGEWLVQWWFNWNNIGYDIYIYIMYMNIFMDIYGYTIYVYVHI